MINLDKFIPEVVDSIIPSFLELYCQIQHLHHNVPDHVDTTVLKRDGSKLTDPLKGKNSQKLYNILRVKKMNSRDEQTGQIQKPKEFFYFFLFHFIETIITYPSNQFK